MSPINATRVPRRRSDAGDRFTTNSTDRCQVIGILNVTPDSFSDGGRYDAPDAAVAHGMRMVEAGADYVDVGGESTRPGAGRISVEEEMHRVLPVVTELSRLGVTISIDTTRAAVARAALDAGAVVVNDVSGGLADLDMAPLVAETGALWVLMHWRGHSKDMYAAATYDDVGADVRRELLSRVDSAVSAGVRPEQLVLDPGLGFAKHPRHDLALLAGLDHLIDLGFPVLVGASRKRFLGSVLTDADGKPRSAAERDAATLVTTALAAHAGAWAVRVHDVAPNVDAVRLVDAVRRIPKRAPRHVPRPVGEPVHGQEQPGGSR